MRDGATDDESEGEERTVLTGRLRLRPPRTADVAALEAALNNPRVAMNLASMPYPYRRADAEAWVERERATIDGPGASRLAICRETGDMVGACVCRPSATRPDGYELSFWVAERFWGQGFGTEIAHAAIDHAFGTGFIQRLWCDLRVTNGPARRVVEKSGFQFRDTGMIRLIATRGAVPVERFVLERRVWQSLKAWGAQQAAHRAARPASADASDGLDRETSDAA